MSSTNTGYIDPARLRIGQRIRVKRPTELVPPEWNADPASNGRFWVNYGKHRVVDRSILGEEYIIDTIRPGTDEIWAYTETEVDGRMVRSANVHLYDSLVAEILSPVDPPVPKCNCGKAVAGRNDPGIHSSWCNITMGYIPARDKN